MKKTKHFTTKKTPALDAINNVLSIKLSEYNQAMSKRKQFFYSPGTREFFDKIGRVK